MIFQHTHELVMSGAKTQTRRIVKPGEETRKEHRQKWAITKNRPLKEWVKYNHWEDVGSISSPDGIVAVWTPKYMIGQTLAVQPGRGKKSVGRIEVLSIRREDVRQISHEDAIAEGFNSKGAFLELWASLHDKPAHSYLHCDMSFAGHQSAGAEITYEGYAAWFKYLQDRPAERYQAWVLEFRLVETS